MRILSGRAAAAHVARLPERGSQLADIEPAVKQIVDDVRSGGDKSLRDLRRTMGWSAKDISAFTGDRSGNSRMHGTQRRRAAFRVAEAAKNIRKFANGKNPKNGNAVPAACLSDRWFGPLRFRRMLCSGRPISASSTVLMTVIPAQVAGVKNIRIVSPKPRPGGARRCRHAGGSRSSIESAAHKHCRAGIWHRKHSARG